MKALFTFFLLVLALTGESDASGCSGESCPRPDATMNAAIMQGLDAQRLHQEAEEKRQRAEGLKDDDPEKKKLNDEAEKQDKEALEKALAAQKNAANAHQMGSGGGGGKGAPMMPPPPSQGGGDKGGDKGGDDSGSSQSQQSTVPTPAPSPTAQTQQNQNADIAEITKQVEAQVRAEAEAAEAARSRSTPAGTTTADTLIAERSKFNEEISKITEAARAKSEVTAQSDLSSPRSQSLTRTSPGTNRDAGDAQNRLLASVNKKNLPSSMVPSFAGGNRAVRPADEEDTEDGKLSQPKKKRAVMKKKVKKRAVKIPTSSAKVRPGLLKSAPRG